MKKALCLAGACGLVALAAGAGFGQDTIGSWPQRLQRQINRLFGRMEQVEQRVTVEEGRLGKQVAPGLYEVHSRVIWDASWRIDTTGAGLNWVTYNEFPMNLTYGRDRQVVLGPLKGYGIPDPAPGATRKVRLFVNYGHQWMCNGTPTVTIGDVDFELPMVSGYYGDMATNWSQFRELSEYQHLGHAPVGMYLKNYYWNGSHCSTSTGAPRGVVYCIVAHFYDEFPVS